MLDQQVERFTGRDHQGGLPGDRPFREPLHRGAGPLRSVGDEVRYPGCVHDFEHGLASSLQLTLGEPGEGIGMREPLSGQSSRRREVWRTQLVT